MNRSSLFSLLCVALLVGSLCTAGCMRERAGQGSVMDTTQAPVVITAPSAGVPAAPGTTAPAVTYRAVKETAGKTCSQLGGDVCTATEDCPGSWQEAMDSFSCCSQTCAGGAGAVLTIEPFDPLPTDEEQNPFSP